MMSSEPSGGGVIGSGRTEGPGRPKPPLSPATSSRGKRHCACTGCPAVTSQGARCWPCYDADRRGRDCEHCPRCGWPLGNYTELGKGQHRAYCGKHSSENPRDEHADLRAIGIRHGSSNLDRYERAGMGGFEFGPREFE